MYKAGQDLKLEVMTRSPEEYYPCQSDQTEGQLI